MKKFTLITLHVFLLTFCTNLAFSQLLSEDFSGDTFPPEGWTIDGAGQTNWISSEASTAGGVAPECQFSWTPAFVDVSRFISPTIATSGLSGVSLTFNHYLNEYSGVDEAYTLYIETTSDGGQTWNEVWSLVDPGENVGPEMLSFLIQNSDVGSDEFQIAFTFDGDSYELNNWNIDDVVVSEALSYDAMAVEVDIQTLIPAGDIVSPMGTVANNGVETITFDVVFTLDQVGVGNVYEETLTVTDLAPYETIELTFPDWTSIDGDFAAGITTQLVDDEDLENNTLSVDIQAVEGIVLLKPLYEEFTSSTCGPCAAGNAILDPVLEANEESHSAIKYQVNWPGSGDPYYTEECATRVDYYGVNYAPDLKINAEGFDLFNMTQEIYDSYLSLTTAMELTVTSAEIDENYNATISVDIDVNADYEAGLTAHIVIVEKTTVGNVMGNGETEFFNVMMKMLPTDQGTTLPALTVGTTETLTESYDMSLTNMEGPNDLMVVVFVQDDSDMSIIQSEHSDIEGEFDTYSVTFNVIDSDGNEVEGAEIFLEANGLGYTDASGQLVYNGIFDGSYDYDVTAAGLFANSGTVSVSGMDETIEVILDVPSFYYYEDFATDLPLDWTSYASGWDYLYWYDGKVIFFRQSGTLDPLMLVSPPIDISLADSIYFELGESSGDPIVAFGTVTDPDDPLTFSELSQYTPGAEWEEYAFDLEELVGSTSEDVYFAWSLIIETNSFFSLNYVIISELANGIEEEQLKRTKVYPNPSSSVLNVESELILNRINLYSTSGQLIKAIEVNTNTFRMDVSGYTPGMYFLQIESDAGTTVKSISIE